MTPAWHKEAIRHWKAGHTAREIAGITGYSLTQVYKVVRDIPSPVSHHRASHMRGRAFDPQWPKKAVRLRRQGMQLSQIARKFGVTRQAVSRECRKAGLPAGRVKWAGSAIGAQA